MRRWYNINNFLTAVIVIYAIDFNSSVTTSDAQAVDCHFDTFTCRNARCIYKDYLCDGIDSCGDKSDEDGCCVKGVQNDFMLHNAVLNGDVARIRWLLDTGYDVNMLDTEQRMPLSQLFYGKVKSNWREIMGLLLERGANLLKPDKIGVAPLELILKEKRFAAFTMLPSLESDAKDYLNLYRQLNLKSMFVLSRIKLVLHRNNWENTESSKEISKLFNPADISYHSALKPDFSNEEVLEEIACLKGKRCDKYELDRRGNTPFMVALIQGRSKKVLKKLMCNDAEEYMNHVNYDGETPLSLTIKAKRTKHFNIIEQQSLMNALVTRGADINQMDYMSVACEVDSPLHIVYELLNMGHEVTMAGLVSVFTWRLDVIYFILDKVPEDSIRLVLPNSLIITLVLALEDPERGRRLLLSIFQSLISCGLQVNYVSQQTASVIHIIVKMYDKLTESLLRPLLTFLVTSEALDNSITIEGKGTAVEYAISLDKLELAAMLSSGIVPVEPNNEKPDKCPANCSLSPKAADWRPATPDTSGSTMLEEGEILDSDSTCTPVDMDISDSDTN